MKNWLFSKRNINGCLIASIGLILYFVGAIDKLWWLIVCALYFSGYYFTKENTQLISVGATISFKENENNFVQLISSSKELLPIEALKILDDILLILKDLNFFMEKNASIFNQEIYSIQSVFDTYLPNIIDKYVRLPKRYAENTKIKDNKTTKDYLIEQLQLLHKHLQDTTHSLYENDSRNLIVNGRFLKEKFSVDSWDSLFEDKEKEINN